MTRDVFPCHTCKKPEHINLLDTKDDGTGNWTICECITCYGPGWNPYSIVCIDTQSVRPDLRPFYDEWRTKHGVP